MIMYNFKFLTLAELSSFHKEKYVSSNDPFFSEPDGSIYKEMRVCFGVFMEKRVPHKSVWFGR